jgi:hypothetical protein
VPRVDIMCVVIALRILVIVSAVFLFACYVCSRGLTGYNSKLDWLVVCIAVLSVWGDYDSFNGYISNGLLMNF